MSETQATLLKMTGVVPKIFVIDVDIAVDFHVTKLGFQLCHRLQDPDCDLAIIERDDVVVHICTCACEGKRHAGNAYFEVRVEDVASLYAQYQAAGVPFKWELKQQPWGQTDFTIIDPESNWITFASPLEDDE